jgi:hypothetical protein
MLSEKILGGTTNERTQALLDLMGHKDMLICADPVEIERTPTIGEVKMFESVSGSVTSPVQGSEMLSPVQGKEPR